MYSGHLPIKLFVYIQQMLQKFCVFLKQLSGCQGGFFWVFCTSQEHVLHFYMCVAYYSQHLPTKVFVYILQMLQKFPIFSGTFTSIPGFFFFWVFHTFLGHVLHFYMCVTYLFKTFTPQIICVHSADALEFPHFPETFTQTPWVFFWLFYFWWILQVMLWRIQFFLWPFIWTPGSHCWSWVLGQTITFRLIHAT